MITTLLLDLDDTLLDNDMDVFLPAYLGLMSTRMASVIPSQQLHRCIMAGSQAMVRNTDPSLRLEEVFDEVFYPGLGVTREALRPIVDVFYSQDFPQLRSLTRPRPAARELVEWAMASGLEVVVATNPLFPRVAIEQRLEWAGVPVREFPYAIVGSYEALRFSKPHPEFLAEILAQLGRQPDNAIIVGDLWGNDVQPAVTLGMHAFWIQPNHTPARRDVPAVAGVGTLEDFLAWAQSGGLASLPATATPPAALPHIVAGNLAGVLDTLSIPFGDRWKTRPSEKEWSLGEIICHLRDVEREVHFPRIQLVAREDNPFVSAVDSDVWAEEQDYCSQDPAAAVRDFIAARKTTLEFLRALPADAWSRPCRHAIFGPTTLAEITSLVSDHDRVHVEQLKTTLQRVNPPPPATRN